MRLALVLTPCVLLWACGDSSSPDASGDASAFPDARADASVSPDAAFPPDAAASPDAGFDPSAVSRDWCDRLIAGGPGAADIAVDLSRAHAEERFFGTDGEYSVADQALAIALQPPDALELAGLGRALSAYAGALPGVCALAASSASLGAAHVELLAGTTIAVITPGTGALSLPAGTTAVAIDLRGLPAVPELRAALESAAALALAQPVPHAVRHVRSHYGMVDEYFAAQNVYTTGTSTRGADPLPGAAAAELPLALLTGPQLAPEAAELAGTLRIARRAWIIGVDVSAEVAESSWHGVGESGLAPRTGDLYDGASRWPDFISADTLAEEPRDHLADLATRGAIPAITDTVSDRAPVGQLTPYGRRQPASTNRGDARAALIAVHGALRFFFPYFAVVGDHLDERLIETLATAGASEHLAPFEAYQLLRRFGEVLHDGHNFIFDPMNTRGIVGAIPILLDSIGGVPIVRHSAVAGIDPGDALLSIDGEDQSAWFARELARTSAATDGYRFDIAARQLISARGPRELVVQAIGGAPRMVHADPQTMFDENVFEDSTRPLGLLGELGAPSIMYVNMTGAVLSDERDFLRAISSTVATGLIVDMRGYPGVDHYDVAQRLIHAPFDSPVFRVPVWVGPALRSINEDQLHLGPMGLGAYWDGPIVLIVGPRTVSAAENFSMMLTGAHRVFVVGRRSAGTNGNICGLNVPMGFAFSFTGMEVLFPDRSLFHTVGIVPDVEVVPTQQDLRDGTDPELMAAIAHLLE